MSDIFIVWYSKHYRQPNINNNSPKYWPDNNCLLFYSWQWLLDNNSLLFYSWQLLCNYVLDNLFEAIMILILLQDCFPRQICPIFWELRSLFKMCNCVLYLHIMFQVFMILIPEKPPTRISLLNTALHIIENVLPSKYYS